MSVIDGIVAGVFALGGVAVQFSLTAVSTRRQDRRAESARRRDERQSSTRPCCLRRGGRSASSRTWRTVSARGLRSLRSISTGWPN